jgi:hypothetical protein
MLRRLIDLIVRDAIRGDRGHARAGAATLVPVAGAIVLAIGAANETDWLTITGGIVLALGVLLASVLHHQVVDWDIYHRIEKLEGK